MGRAKLIIFVIGMMHILLSGCITDSNTVTAISSSDIPASKYKQIAVFVENVPDAERPANEQTIVAALKNAGANAISQDELFFGSASKLTEASKIKTIRGRGVDALLYVRISTPGEALISNARWSQGMIQLTNDDGSTSMVPTSGYTIKPDGSVYSKMNGLTSRAELQDVNSAKVVFTADTLTYSQYRTSILGMAIPDGTSNSSLMNDLAKEVVAKLRAGRAI